MKKTLFFVFCSLSFLVSCDKIFLDVEGKDADLQGKWQMDNADTVYFNFQKNLFQYQIYRKKGDASTSVAYGYYTLHGDTAIDLKLLREFSPFPLDYLGWDTLYAAAKKDTLAKTFKIKEINNKKLIIFSDNETLSFHKF
jgi:hypothetical protein